jgi:hypothetical protein
VATVKRHAITIYRKLKVNKRREAIVKAEKLGILPVREQEEDPENQQGDKTTPSDQKPV